MGEQPRVVPYASPDMREVRRLWKRASHHDARISSRGRVRFLPRTRRASSAEVAIRDRYWRVAVCRGIVGSRGDFWERSANSKAHQAARPAIPSFGSRVVPFLGARERRGPRGGHGLGNRGHEAHPRRTECAPRATAVAREWLRVVDGRSAYAGVVADERSTRVVVNASILGWVRR